MMKTLLIVFTLALSFSGCTYPENTTAESLNVGRYQLMQIGNLRRDQFLIDTATGKVWQSVCSYKGTSKEAADCDYSSFQSVDIVGLTTTQDTHDTIVKFMENRNKRRSSKQQ